MKNGDSYRHFKGGEYQFHCIALPKADEALMDSTQVDPEPTQNAIYHDGTRTVKLFEAAGVTFIDADVPHVIYQSEKDFGTDKVYAREVDDFFGYKDNGVALVKRFSLIKS